MVVTPTALQRQPHDGSRQHVERLVHDLISFLNTILRKVGVVVHRPQKSGRRQQFHGLGREPLRFPPVDQFITRQLLDQKPIKRLVRIPRLHHVVAISPQALARVNRGQIIIELPIDISRRIQPVPGPAFSIVGGMQQPLDEPFIGIDRTILDKLLDGLRTGWQPCQIQARATDQCSPVRLGRILHTRRFQSAQQEGIHRCADRRLVSHRRRLDSTGWLKRPEFSILGRHHVPRR